MIKLKATTAIFLAAFLTASVPTAILAQTPDGDASLPAEFSGQWEYVRTFDSGESTTAAGTTNSEGGSWGYRVLEMSDPRMDGATTISANVREFDSVDTGIYNGGFTIENAAGSWHETPTPTLALPDGTGSTRTSAFIGAGDYEGLTAVVELAWDRTGNASVFDVRGIIIEGALPQAPGSPLGD
jgi:hypothetical protein